MLIVQKMWKNTLNHSSIIAKYWIANVLIYYNKCKMQIVNNDFNILKLNNAIHVQYTRWWLKKCEKNHEFIPI